MTTHLINTTAKPKRKHWLRRWVKRVGTTTAPSRDPFSLGVIEQEDLEDLVQVVAGRRASIAMLSLTEIHVGEAWRGGIFDVQGIQEATGENLLRRQELLPQNKHYSIKRLPPGKQDKKGLARSLKLLIREATILVKIGDHPNILSLRGLPSELLQTGSSLHASDFFLLTDRPHGDTLEQRIRKWKTQGYYHEFNVNDDETDATPDDDGIPRKTNYAFQIARAVQACHKAGIVLRDVSPQNICFLQQDPHCIQLVDLGNAWDTSIPASPRAPLVGRRRYMAGEIWTTGEYSKASDTYSWAILFYEILMERKPYIGLSALEHQLYVCEGAERPPLASYYLPQGIDDVLTKAWEHHPSKRITIDQVCERLQTILMDLDTFLFYEPEDDDFLFDVFVPAGEDDAVSDWDGSDLGGYDDDEVLVDELMIEAELEEIFQASGSRLVIPDDYYNSSKSDIIGNARSTPTKTSSFTTTISTTPKRKAQIAPSAA